MRRKLWPKAPAKEGALGQMSKNFKVYFIHINFFFEIKQKNFKWNQRFILRCYFIFLILYCLLAQKKMETEKWPKVADSPLLIDENFRFSL